MKLVKLKKKSPVIDCRSLAVCYCQSMRVFSFKAISFAPRIGLALQLNCSNRFFSTLPPNPPIIGGGGSAPKSSLVDITEANFGSEIMSSDKPVIIDVWASWCEPCRRLSPMIEDMAKKTPQVKFVKLNADEQERISSELQIQKLPTLLAIFKGKLMEPPIVGLPTPESLQDFVNRVTAKSEQVTEQSSVEEEVKALIANGEKHLEMGDLPGAAQMFEQSIQVGGDSYPGGFAGIAIVAMSQGDMETAANIIAKLKTIKGHETDSLSKKAMGSVELAKSLQELLKEMNELQVEEGTNDHLFLQAIQYCTSGQADKAVENLLTIIKRDKVKLQKLSLLLTFPKKHYRDGPDSSSPRGLLFKIFNAIGQNHPLTISGRKRLSALLFM